MNWTTFCLANSILIQRMENTHRQEVLITCMLTTWQPISLWLWSWRHEHKPAIVSHSARENTHTHTQITVPVAVAAAVAGSDWLIRSWLSGSSCEGRSSLMPRNGATDERGDGRRDAGTEYWRGRRCWVDGGRWGMKVLETEGCFARLQKWEVRNRLKSRCCHDVDDSLLLIVNAINLVNMEVSQTN